MGGAYSPTPVAYPTPRTRPPSAGTAETLVLVALVLQVIAAVVILGLFLLLFGFAAFHSDRATWVFALVASVVGGLSLLFLYCAYEYSYLRIQRGQYQEAQAPTLVLGILSLFLGLIPGILYLVGYLKIGDAMREAQGPPGGYSYPYGFPPATGPMIPQLACRGCGRVYFVGQFPFCPNCGQKLGP
ncbi:MAG TPA: hypothetical protein VN819_03120 [Thermoplasmata archaeon]|nr:hypothetical protein [Thermoplasmata archaeon]